jgi:(1->4)-alpha-D-glucan 1-alpha-D-glucosylmutase
MIPLLATYRLQFRVGMDLHKAASLVPYLSSLGISHLYASPISEAAPESSHGYDVTEYNVIDPALGGEEGLKKLADALRAHGMGMILDFVPNHMSASPANAWWRDVLEWGEQSPHASYFDIDWTAPKLLIPALPEPYGIVLERKGFSLSCAAASGTLWFAAGTTLPLTPPSYAFVLADIASGELTDLANRFGVATPETAAELKADFASRLAEPSTLGSVEARLKELSSNPDQMHNLHEAQVWRLAYWRTARERLTYRRFFEIADLVGMRVEQPSVFEDCHRLLLSLVADGVVHGIRLDHIDGLADPKSYLQRLRKALGSDEHPVFVEKIVAESETLRSDWGVQGTTGYEFIRSLGGLLTSPAGETSLSEAYETFIGESLAYASLLHVAKRHVLIRNLAGELDLLTNLAATMADADLTTRDFGRDTLRRAIIEIAVGLPVYRTYVDVEGAQPEDQALIEDAVAAAKASRQVEDELAIDFIASIWSLDFQDPIQRASALQFTMRLQQTTGPLMAKAVEDTLFYRYNRLIALNEVGGSPDFFGCDPGLFHQDMEGRRALQPRGLLATSTHDSKRGEDTRTRLYRLSEQPELFRTAIARWSDLNAPSSASLENGRAPSRNDEWMFYQSLLGAWPHTLQPADRNGLEALRKRMSAFMLKAVREAKLHTSWTAPNTAYEKGLEKFVEAVLDPGNAEFLSDFTAVQNRLSVAGALASLSQTLFKLTAPGIPDIYQGAELWDLSLVDPDNRRPVDFTERERLLGIEASLPPEELLNQWRTGLPKLRLIRAVLAERKAAPDLFTAGAYEPLQLSGSTANAAIGFLRTEDSKRAITVAPIRVLELLDDSPLPVIPAARWEDTAIAIAASTPRRWRNVFTGESIDGRELLPLSELLREFPVALLVSA